MRFFLLALSLLTFLLLPSGSYCQTLRGFTVNSYITKADFDVLASWKADVIRFHLHWGDQANSANAEEYLEWLDSALPELDDVIGWAAEKKVKVVVNIHTPPGGFRRSTYPSLHRLFVEPWAKDTLIEAWKRITKRYKGISAIWGFDILNEPAVSSSRLEITPWDVIANEVATAIRTIDPKRTIIVEPVYGDQARLGSIRKVSIPNMVVSVHAYYPLNFHHQGIYGNPINMTYPTKKFNRSSILKNYRGIIRFQQKRKIPVYIGEFTAVRWAPKNSAFHYLKDIIPLFERFKWNWTYHSFRESEAWNVELGTKYKDLTPPKRKTDREKLLRRYFAKNAKR